MVELITCVIQTGINKHVKSNQKQKNHSYNTIRKFHVICQIFPASKLLDKSCVFQRHSSKKEVFNYIQYLITSVIILWFIYVFFIIIIL